jgi:hypothetical protein
VKAVMNIWISWKRKLYWLIGRTAFSRELICWLKMALSLFQRLASLYHVGIVIGKYLENVNETEGMFPVVSVSFRLP